MFESFALRQLLAFIAQATRIEKLPEREQEWPDFFDNTKGIGPVERQLFYKHRSGVMLPFKGHTRPVPIEEKIGIEAHITAVKFGTTSRARKFWRKLIESEEIPPEIWQLFGKTPEGAAQQIGRAHV